MVLEFLIFRFWPVEILRLYSSILVEAKRRVSSKNFHFCFRKKERREEDSCYLHYLGKSCHNFVIIPSISFILPTSSLPFVDTSIKAANISPKNRTHNHRPPPKHRRNGRHRRTHRQILLRPPRHPRNRRNLQHRPRILVALSFPRLRSNLEPMVCWSSHR